MLRINYLCGRITNWAWSFTIKIRVVICSELTTFAVESPTIIGQSKRVLGCDLLRINYLCGRITNRIIRKGKRVLVVICSELTTFAVESPTKCIKSRVALSCDLLRINYLCGRITNYSVQRSTHRRVVICSELTTFAVESPTEHQDSPATFCCDLLRINYLCGRITNDLYLDAPRDIVVICSELTTFAVESPTG